MRSLPVIFLFFFSILCLCRARGQTGRFIVVDQSGRGNFKTIQEAINSVPSFSRTWTQILVKSGVYNEKLVIPREKQRILLRGESRWGCIIQTDQGGEVDKTATFNLDADHFVARNLTFQNTYNARSYYGKLAGRPVSQAPAAQIKGDKAAFFDCSFISLQDTLSDIVGRHYFERCYIQGAIDFIWGFGQSVYERCILNATGGYIGVPGFITAQGRERPTDPGGFVFRMAVVEGTGRSYLGRAYRKYSRVVFYKSAMSRIVVPEGWDTWNHKGREGSITFSEVGCVGPGSRRNHRVKWERRLSRRELNSLVNVKNFIDQDGWLDKFRSLN